MTDEKRKERLKAALALKTEARTTSAIRDALEDVSAAERARLLFEAVLEYEDLAPGLAADRVSRFKRAIHCYQRAFPDASVTEALVRYVHARPDFLKDLFDDERVRRLSTSSRRHYSDRDSDDGNLHGMLPIPSVPEEAWPLLLILAVIGGVIWLASVVLRMVGCLPQ